jgi:hypothetical protein
MKLHLHERGLELFRVFQVRDILKESVPQGYAGIDDRSMA